MNEAEFLKRFDSHQASIDHSLSRIDEHMERNSDLMAEVREELRLMREEAKLSREEAERSRRLHEELRADREDTRTFMRELTRRSEIILHEVVEEMAQQRDQLRANTQAVLAMIDRLGPAAG